MSVAGHIMSGFYDVGISGGVESMSTTDMSSSVPDVNWEKVADCPLGSFSSFHLSSLISLFLSFLSFYCCTFSTRLYSPNGNHLRECG